MADGGMGEGGIDAEFVLEDVEGIVKGVSLPFSRAPPTCAARLCFCRS
jgi:hypothetical protein